MKTLPKSLLKDEKSCFLYKEDVVEIYNLFSRHVKNFSFTIGNFAIEDIEDFNNPSLINYKTGSMDVTVYTPSIHFWINGRVSKCLALDSDDAASICIITKIEEIIERSISKYGVPKKDDYINNNLIKMINYSQPDEATDIKKVKIMDPIPVGPDNRSFFQKNRDILLVILGSLIGAFGLEGIKILFSFFN